MKPTLTQGIERTMLLSNEPIAASGAYEATLGIATIAPGITTARHYHYGDDIGVVLDGELEIDIEGQGIIKVKTGEAFHVPAGKAHTNKNAGSVPVKVVGIWIVEKGKPLAINTP